MSNRSRDGDSANAGIPGPERKLRASVSAAGGAIRSAAGAFLRALRILRVLIVVIVVAALWVRLGPLPDGLLTPSAIASVEVLDRHGVVLYEARGADGQRGEWMSASALPAHVVNATLAAEDTRFFSHVGVDPLAIGRAAIANLRARRVVQGGSTITQQVAKLLLARQQGAEARRGWGAKMREAVVALRLEHRLEKRDILALYLNLAPYGNQIAGIARASRGYFGRAPETLTAAEAAFLAALPQQPGRFNPWRDAARARPRQQRILRTMRDRGWLSPADSQVAAAERLTIGRDVVPPIAPHFVERVLSLPASGSHTIRTTLDAALQSHVQGIVAAHRPALDRHHAANVAVAVLDNRTGDWLAWEGSGNYFDGEHGGAIDGVITPRQPGSALKPFTYAAAFERGDHPGVVLPDVPSQFTTAEAGVLYSPRNYDGRFRGPLSMRAALAGSVNVPAVALASEIGVPAVLRLLRRAGFTTLDRTASHYGLGVTLGNAEVTLAELVAAYAAIARGGEAVMPRLTVGGDDGQTPSAAQRVMSEQTAFLIADILADDDARAFAFGRGGSLDFPFPVAVKTGTSQAYHDNWTIGFTRDVTVGVWVGNFDRQPLRQSSGVTGAGPIFHDVMMAAVERVRGGLPIGDVPAIASPPAGVTRRELCALSGLSPTAACPRRTSDWVPLDATHTACTWHHDTDAGVVTVWPEAYRAWAGVRPGSDHAARPKASGISDFGVSGFSASGKRTRGDEPKTARRPRPLTITSPAADAIFLLDTTLRPEFQTLALRAAGAAPGSVEWSIDGRVVGRTTGDVPWRWPMTRGRHVVSARDSDGQTAEVIVTVK